MVGEPRVERDLSLSIRRWAHSTYEACTLVSLRLCTGRSSARNPKGLNTIGTSGAPLTGRPPDACPAVDAGFGGHDINGFMHLEAGPDGAHRLGV